MFIDMPTWLFMLSVFFVVAIICSLIFFFG